MQIISTQFCLCLLVQELIHEKEALQKQLQDQMIQISALKNQLDEMRHRGDLGGESHTATLQGQLERRSQTLEDKEKQVSYLPCEKCRQIFSMLKKLTYTSNQGDLNFLKCQLKYNYDM